MSQETQRKKKVGKFWTAWNIVESLVLIAAGVLSIVAGILHKPAEPGTAETIEKTIAYFVASFIILDGILRVVLFLVRYNKNDDTSPFVTSGFELSAGVLIILLQLKYEDFFVYGIVNFVAVLLMVIGILLLTFAIFVLVKKYVKFQMPVLEILLAAILIGVGITIEIIYNTSDAKQKLVLIMAGAILLIAGLSMFIITIVTSKKNKKEIKKAEDEEQGNYDVIDSASKSNPASTAVVPAEIVDAEEPEKKNEIVPK